MRRFGVSFLLIFIDAIFFFFVCLEILFETLLA